ncbi:hypothetical protein [Mycolicibacterium fortuitum]|uniref:hypothetical protein n=1 Tax=Mycolicibacterium fortuitum TaxID=1766 RepID=UPI00241F2166|nr:hypothetical protein [Mycolicibacterium fortuitum]MDG5773938.1 hypothetical protein [Mycolicibacterium fortuitum]MDG5779676.1 hypothetical protein [Mycolicibacterium fortuitum]
MKRKLAHGMRRTARALIKWPNRLEPHFEHIHVAPSLKLGAVDGYPWVRYTERTDGFESREL